MRNFLQKIKTKFTEKKKVLIPFGIICLIVFGLIYYLLPSDADKLEKDVITELSHTLVSPSTAQYSFIGFTKLDRGSGEMYCWEESEDNSKIGLIDRNKVKIEDGIAWQVRVSVDAQNYYGAMIQDYFICVVDREEDDVLPKEVSCAESSKFELTRYMCDSL